MIVLDASAAIELLLATPVLGHEAARAIASSDGAVHAPHLLDADVGQVLRRLVRMKAVPVRRAARALARLQSFPMIRHPHVPFLARAFELRANATFYDSLYLALAEELDAQLLTADAALGSIPGHRARVIVLA